MTSEKQAKLVASGMAVWTKLQTGLKRPVAAQICLELWLVYDDVEGE